MKLTLMLAPLLVASIWGLVTARNRRARAAEEAAAMARQRAARRNRVPVVSNNVKGVTASQTIDPYRAPPSGTGRDERAA